MRSVIKPLALAVVVVGATLALPGLDLSGGARSGSMLGALSLVDTAHAEGESNTNNANGNYNSNDNHNGNYNGNDNHNGNYNGNDNHNHNGNSNNSNSTPAPTYAPKPAVKQY